MPDVVFADPTTTTDASVQKMLNVLPPIEERPPTVAPPTPVPVTRPTDNHAAPHTLPPIQEEIRQTGAAPVPKSAYDDLPSGGG
ncbi:hypothetical protein [Nostoc sp.]|uniref:hypothetical protein n=1 Tax=Nostoc sp. TaxID=1180 RepID=UPI002FF9C577